MDQTGAPLNTDKNFNINDVNFYSPIDSSQQIEIITYLKNNSLSVTYKIDDTHSKSSFVEVSGQDLSILKKTSNDYSNQFIYCCFLYKSEMHLFRSKATSSSNYLLLTVPDKIYKLQRRNDFRLSIPALIKQKIKLIEYPKIDCQMVDISLGGCRLTIKTTTELELVEETDITVSYQFNSEESQTNECTIVFSKFNAEAKLQTLGLKFNNLDSNATSHLHQMLIQIDRSIRTREN